MKLRTTPAHIIDLRPNECFVFGSNQRGIHGKGAARTAIKWGAIPGQGVGRAGSTYALPTCLSPGMPLPLDFIQVHVDAFIAHAAHSPETTFLVTEVGCGLAGYKPSQIAPMFVNAMQYDNIHLPELFWHILAL